MIKFLSRLLQFLYRLFGDSPNTPDPIEPPTENTPTFPLKAHEITSVNLAEGEYYTLQETDMLENNKFSFEPIAEDRGMHGSSLREFNVGNRYEAGDDIYIPSGDELCFMEYCRTYKDIDLAAAAYAEMPARPNRIMLDTARYRGAGKIGESYATNSTTFYSPNDELAGASVSRSEMINGQREYRVNWGTDVWKCNVFMHDCTYHADYEPDMSDREGHYIRAGRLHYSEKFEPISIEEATPGCVIQLYGGEDSDASHNMILMSFIERDAIDDGGGVTVERWVFKGMGAERERVAVSIRTHYVRLDDTSFGYKTYAEMDGTKREYLRLFKPKNERAIV